MLCEADILILILQVRNQRVRHAKWFAQRLRSSIIMSTAAFTHIAASIATIRFSKLLIIFRYNSNFVCHPLGYDKLET